MRSATKSHSKPMRVATLVAVLVSTVALPLAAAEKWWDFYKRGTAAAQVSDWSTVSEQMQRSIAEKPNEETAARAKNEILVYVPHFWLGVAKLNLGDVEGALAEWRTSESMGVIQKTQYWSELRKWRSHAEGQKAKKASEQSSGSRKSADAALQKAMRGQMAAITAGADRLPSFQSAKWKLKEAWDQYNAAGNDVKAFDKAAATASAANDLFVAAADEAKKRKAAKKGSTPTPAEKPPVEVPMVVTTTTHAPPVAEPEVEAQAVVDARVSVQTMRRKLQTTKTTTADQRSFVRDAQRKADGWDRELRTGVTPAEAAEISAEVAALDRALAEVLVETVPVEMTTTPTTTPTTTAVATTAGTTTSVVAPAPTKPKLQTAYVAFANGSLGESEAILEAYIAQHRKAAEAYLLRGCVRYTRAMLSREPAKSLPGAEADFRKALELNRRIGLDSRQFSPKLVAYFNDVRKQSAGVR